MKSVLIILVIIISYLLLFSVVAVGFAQQPNSMGNMSAMMGGSGDDGGMGGMMNDTRTQGDEGDQMMDNGSMDDMMNQTGGNNQSTPTSTSPNSLVSSLVALTVALVAGALVSLLIMSRKPEAPAAIATPATRTDELEIIKRVLSDDEKAVLDEIRRAGEITQDSLRFRLEWSKSKLSRILTNLDKMNLIQRERVGKTYTVFLTGKRPKQ
jgi:uncharacterized membrane protein